MEGTSITQQLFETYIRVKRMIADSTEQVSKLKEWAEKFVRLHNLKLRKEWLE